MHASPEAPAELLALQAQMLRAICTTAERSVPEVAAHMATPPRGRAVARIEVYRRMFRARTEEVLRSDFPILCSAFAETELAAWIARYLLRCPPRSWTLADLGRALPRFLGDDLECPDELLPAPWPRALLVDLARAELRLERSRTARRGPPLELAALHAVPLERWDRLQLVLAPQLELLRVRFDLRACLRGGALDARHPPQRRGLRLALRWSGAGREVERIDTFAERLLRALRSGVPLGRAIERASACLPAATSPERLAERLFTLLRAVAARGGFVHPAHVAPTNP